MRGMDDNMKDKQWMLIPEIGLVEQEEVNRLLSEKNGTTQWDDGLCSEAQTIVDTWLADDRSIIVGGKTGSGKSYLLDQLVNAVPENDKVVAIKDRDVADERTIAHLTEEDCSALIKHALHEAVDVVTVSELRGAETWDVLQFTAHQKAQFLTTMHAEKAADVPSRLLNMIRLHNENRGSDVDLAELYDVIREVVDVVLQMDRVSIDGKVIRYVKQAVVFVDGECVPIFSQVLENGQLRYISNNSVDND